MKKRTKFQVFIFGVIKFILQDQEYLENWDKSEYKKFVGENLRRYCEYTSKHKGIVNSPKRLRENCKFTKEAIDEIEKANSDSWSILKSVIHQEHILPISEAIRQLSSIENKNDDEAIYEVLDKIEIIVISKRQRNLLDGAGGVGMKSTGEPMERLNAIGASLHPSYMHNQIK